MMKRGSNDKRVEKECFVGANLLSLSFLFSSLLFSLNSFCFRSIRFATTMSYRRKLIPVNFVHLLLLLLLVV